MKNWKGTPDALDKGKGYSVILEHPVYAFLCPTHEGAGAQGRRMGRKENRRAPHWRVLSVENAVLNAEI